MNLNDLATDCNNYAIRQGFRPDDRPIGVDLMLITSELSEALEADRKNRYADVTRLNELIKDRRDQIDDILNYRLPARSHTIITAQNETEDETFKNAFEIAIKDSVEDELADALIRILEYCGEKNIDIQLHYELKMKYNNLRPYKHGKTY